MKGDVKYPKITMKGFFGRYITKIYSLFRRLVSWEAVRKMARDKTVLARSAAALSAGKLEDKDWTMGWTVDWTLGQFLLNYFKKLIINLKITNKLVFCLYMFLYHAIHDFVRSSRQIRSPGFSTRVSISMTPM